MQGRADFVWKNDLVDISNLTRQIIGQAFFGTVHIGGKGAVAKVAINDQHALTFDSQGNGHINGQEGLTRARVERSQDENISCLILHHKFQIGTQHTECFVNHIALPFFDHRILDTEFFRFLVFFGFKPLKEFLLTHFRFILRNLTNKRQGQVFQIFLSANGGITDLFDINED